MTTTTATTEVARQAIKSDILAYCASIGVTNKDALIKTCQAVKDAAFNCAPLDEEMLRDRQIRAYAAAVGVKKGEDFYFQLSWKFSAPHYTALVEFVKRYEALLEEESKAEMELEQAIQEEIQGMIDPLADEYYDEMGAPDCAICIYSDRIEVRAYVKGIGDRLPKKGRKYIGSMHDVRWQFPLSSLPQLKALGYPVVDTTKLAKQGK